jgi:glycine/D-amino acid oxidase-like deaminating enzyme
MSPEALLGLPLTIAPSGAYCRPENADRLLMGWAHDATPEADFSYEDQDRIEPAFSHRTGTETAAYETWATLAEVVPAFAEFPGIVATTSGYYGSTPDHNPFLDYDPLVPNLLRLSGFSGHGAMFGPFTALVGDALVQAGASIPQVEVLGEAIQLAPFAIGRDFSGAEQLVI